MAPRRHAGNVHVGGLLDVAGNHDTIDNFGNVPNLMMTTQCCTPTGECLRNDILIRMNCLQDVVKVTCNNDNCPMGQYMHRECFDAWEQTVLTYLKNCGRARSWSERQRHQNLWTKKGYDLAFKACGCRCGRGHLKKDLDWMPPGPHTIGNRSDDAEAKKKKRRNRQNTRPSLSVSAGPPHGNHGNNRPSEAQIIESSRGRAGSLSSSNGSCSPPATSETSVSPMHQPQAIGKKKSKVEFFGDHRLRQSCGANGIFSRRLDFSAFNSLPKTKLNSYHIKESARIAKREKFHIRDFLKRPMLKALGIAHGVMGVQQLSGINAIIFNAVTIFEATGVDLDPVLQGVVLGVVQVIACCLSALLIDKIGRKVLMILSQITMCLCLLALAGFFVVKEMYPEMSEIIYWIPLAAMCFYCLGYCIGAGPVPWAYIGEIFPTKLKGTAASSAAFINWFLAFFITLSFESLVNALGNAAVLFIFSFTCALSIFFVAIFMIETKGKSLFAILKDFGNLQDSRVIEDEGNHGNDDTRCFILSTLAALQWSRVSCVLCRAAMLVFDRYPLVDGTFFLSPRQHSHSCAEVKVEGRTQFLSAVCMNCLEGSGSSPVRCRTCTQPWDGSSLVLGTMYSYDIFAAMPCCTERLTCNSCQKPLIYPHQRLNFYSDYSRVFACPHCRTVDAHFVKPLSACYTREQYQLYSQWP